MIDHVYILYLAHFPVADTPAAAGAGAAAVAAVAGTHADRMDEIDDSIRTNDDSEVIMLSRPCRDASRWKRCKWCTESTTLPYSPYHCVIL